MKTYDKYSWMAALKAVHEFSSMKSVAKAFVEHLNKEKEVAEINDTKSDGFIIRKKGDVSFTDGRLYDNLAKAIKDILDKKSEEVADYMSDKYEIDYETVKLNGDFTHEMFDITRNGRLIYVEEDV